ncbi:MAG: hypothetical protein ABWY06_13700 [Pseudomonas sp.]|uniref:HvfA family oxazolone/thioamide-modified RiPP metallophore n=1 Tax=Pseudomonas sp. TaxID=306 RepID=UPI0033994595
MKMVATLGMALLSVTSLTLHAGQNPFAAQELASGYSLAAHEKNHEGACGEGKCGAEGAAKADSEGTCGGEGEKKTAVEGGSKAATEGKCGEGKCGAEQG